MPRSWIVASVAAIIMVALALLGVGLTNQGSQEARNYWMILVPIYGVLCIITAWATHRQEGGVRRAMVIRQTLHWLGVAGAMGLDFLIGSTGEQPRVATGFSALLLLALGCYLAGVFFTWQFVLVGLLLTITFILGLKAEQYLWLVFMIGAGAVAILLGARWLANRLGFRKGHKQEAHPSPTH
jgi:hypothetical protein